MFKARNISVTLLALVLLVFSLPAEEGFAAGGRGGGGPVAKTRAPAAVNPAPVEQVFVPGGWVVLGSDAKEKEFAYEIGGEGARKWRWFDSEARRRVFVKDFYIDKYPVTQSQYHLFVRETGYRYPYISADDYRLQGFLVHSYEEVKPYLWVRGDEGFAPPKVKIDDPVVLVSVDDAAAYCRWRGSSLKGRTFRLPYEDEWEKAARGTDGRYFPWGNVWDGTRANIGQTGPGGTTPVYKYPGGQSPYGVYDMAGNVFEWTLTVDPAGPDRNILKSCSWDDMPGICRGAARHSRLKKSRHILIGFRCVSIVR
ncbi:MAG: formylglycine-generating enzyme family protein [Thermodesulfobacteriota bacterium]|nr:MAG: formylglycine-generating enzyme family protein [Thermodesulfobacteriota bacterium]